MIIFLKPHIVKIQQKKTVRTHYYILICIFAKRNDNKPDNKRNGY